MAEGSQSVQVHGVCLVFSPGQDIGATLTLAGATLEPTTNQVKVSPSHHPNWDSRLKHWEQSQTDIQTIMMEASQNVQSISALHNTQ